MMTLNSIIIVIFIASFVIFSQQNEVKPDDQQSKDVEKTFTKIGLEVPQPNQRGTIQYPPPVQFGQRRYDVPDPRLGYGPQPLNYGYNPNLYNHPQPGPILGPNPPYNGYDLYNRANIYRPPQQYYPGQPIYGPFPKQNTGKIIYILLKQGSDRQNATQKYQNLVKKVHREKIYK
ncbi:unnamed protein product [Meloidogyne enterolobii]|uniref:Uncharacterized protein n=1 Tax=Meloidogyne enterolobii TaxID=390850 RepID=A0ACB1AH01_MELEN